MMLQRVSSVAPAVCQNAAANSALQQQLRGMATLKTIQMRLKSVKNIQKITQSMKMVSAAKYARAERDLKKARPYGIGAQQFYEKAEVALPDNTEKKQLFVAITSDRGEFIWIWIGKKLLLTDFCFTMTYISGLCGAVHTGIARFIRNALGDATAAGNTKIICVGDKSRAILQRLYNKNILLVANEVGRLPPTFLDASKMADQIMLSGYEFTNGALVFNRFKSVVSYSLSQLPIYSRSVVQTAPKLDVYDSLDEDVIQSYLEFSLASLLFYTMKEGACSEQSSRMTAMDNASKNAGEMIEKLSLLFNRTRQAVITRELIEIISGASALSEKD